jgi:hypothetical protein
MFYELWSLRHQMVAGLLAGLASLTILGALTALPGFWFWVSLSAWLPGSLLGLWAMLRHVRSAYTDFFEISPWPSRLSTTFTAMALLSAFWLADPPGRILERIGPGAKRIQLAIEDAILE